MTDLRSHNFNEFYQNYLQQNNLKQDAWQLEISNYFNNLAQQLQKTHSSSLLRKIFNQSNIQGIYLWGGVGRGKTMKCKIFAEYLGQFLPKIKKLFIHYHDFIKLIHEQIHQAKINNPAQEPIIQAARYIINNYDLIILDEFQILDISDAMILFRIFEEFYLHKIVLILTSNREPNDLYHDSYGREHVNKFVQLLYTNQQVIALNGPNDYRSKKILNNRQLFFFPNTPENNQKIDQIVSELTLNRPLIPHRLEVFGRNINFPNTYQQILVSDFYELCCSNFSQNDYITICNYFKIIVIKNIPKLTSEMSNEAKRFIMLVDQAYNHKTILILSLECEINLLYIEGKGSFEFSRTISRLYEMQSTDYTQAKFSN